jgi:hypothetical protein
MEIIINDTHCIITPLSKKLTRNDVERLKQEIYSIDNKKIGLNLLCVNECTIEFFDLIKNIKNLGLFNINSDLFAILLSMNFDKVTKLYVCENDFIDEARQLLARKFQIV